MKPRADTVWAIRRLRKEYAAALEAALERVRLSRILVDRARDQLTRADIAYGSADLPTRPSRHAGARLAVRTLAADH